MSIQKPKVGREDVSKKFPKVSGKGTSPIAPLDDHDPEDKAGSYEGHIGGEPRKGGRTSGVVGQTRQRTGTAQSEKVRKSAGRPAARRIGNQK
jgi:hypothetical protein